MENGKGDQRRIAIALILIAAGVFWYYHLLGWLANIAFGPVLGLAVGVYLLYRWYVLRTREGRSSPWLFGVGAVVLLDNVDAWLGQDIKFMPMLLIVVGLAFLLDRRAGG